MMPPNNALIHYVFPNDAHIHWTLMIVVYPYITGLIAGAFVVSSLYHVFHVQAFKGIARFALVASLCFGLFAGTPLLFHLGQPQRAFSIFITPHLTSAMSLFGFVYAAYMVLLMVEIWLVYRSHFIQRAQETGHWFWQALCLWVTEIPPEAERIDRRLITLLAGLGIPMAFLLHGYVGFVFGSVKAVAWWATPLQPIIFLMSAIVSGIAALALLYSFILWRRRAPYDHAMLQSLFTYLWGLFLIDYTLEILEVISVFYEHGHHWTVVGPLLNGPLQGSYQIGQMGLLSLGPILLLGGVVLLPLGDRLRLWLGNLSALMLVLQVLFMRFNVVVGGQMISKSDRGFVPFHWEWFAKEGVLTALVLLAAPLVTYYILSRFIPILDQTPSDLPSKYGQREAQE
jgi:Ni/Fe-hydrogenase subunit HybB-like protein